MRFYNGWTPGGRIYDLNRAQISSRFLANCDLWITCPAQQVGDGAAAILGGNKLGFHYGLVIANILLTDARLFLQTDIYYCTYVVLLISSGLHSQWAQRRGWLRVLTKKKSLCYLAADSSCSELLPLSSHSITLPPTCRLQRVIILLPKHSPI